MESQIRVRGFHIDAVDVLVDGPGESPANAVVVLAHGAGSDHRAPALAWLAASLCAHGIEVWRPNLPFRQAAPGRTTRRPAPAADVTAWVWPQIVDHVAQQSSCRRIVIGGHSYGGRTASLAVANGLDVAGLLLLGYPLWPPKADRATRRDGHWPTISAPTMIVQGAKDDRGTSRAIRAAAESLAGPHRVLTIAGGRHDLTGRRRASGGRARVVSHEQALGPHVRELAKWVLSCAHG